MVFRCGLVVASPLHLTKHPILLEDEGKARAPVWFIPHKDASAKAKNAVAARWLSSVATVPHGFAFEFTILAIKQNPFPSIGESYVWFVFIIERDKLRAFIFPFHLYVVKLID